MNSNTIEYLIRELEKIKAKINHLESDPNRAFILIEPDTLNMFHWFSLCFKHFWKEEFDRKSASHLLLYQDIVKTHSELSGRYTSLVREQMDYLRDVLTFDKKTSKDLNPVFFGEEKNKDLLDYYEAQLKNELDIKGEPLYKSAVVKNIYFEDIEKKSPPFDFYVFRSDSINDTYYKGLLGLYYCLKSIYKLMCVVCSYPNELVSGYKPSQEENIVSLEFELRQYTKEVGSNVERDLKKTAQELKPSRSSHLNPDVWGEVMKKEDELFDLAIKGKLGEVEEKRFENISATKEQLMDNFSLLQKIKTTCLDGELFDIRLCVETHQLLSSLNSENLDLFYELVLRRNIIQREMFPDELRAKYDEWVNPPREQQTNEKGDAGLSEARKSKLEELISKMQNGQWKEPATSDKIARLLKTIFGRDISPLDEGDINLCERMWAWAEGGGGDRNIVVPANLAGFFSEENLLAGSPKEISNDLFGKSNNQSNNINKGNPKRCSNAFNEVLPFLRKYTNKIVRQE